MWHQRKCQEDKQIILDGRFLQDNFEVKPNDSIAKLANLAKLGKVKRKI